MPIPTPNSPFPEFKWKWATNEPTEGLNNPPVFLGVLRAMSACDGLSTSSHEFQERLHVVQSETHTQIDLVRSRERNLIRNSGQYWKAKGLIQPTRGKIVLTEFGAGVASGQITRAEFAASVIQNYELPNDIVFTPHLVNKWVQAGIKIRPLNLILNIVSSLANNFGSSEGYITASELAKVTVPLSSASTDPGLHSEAVHKFRNNTLDVRTWPNCAPTDNDLRILREFLIFLSEYGYLEPLDDGATRPNIKYFVPHGLIKTIESFVATAVAAATPHESVVQEIRRTGVISGVERRRAQRTVTERLGQDRFRKDILASSGNECLLTREKISDVLEAAHIIPVEDSGSDEPENGLCLRADIHILFDSSHMRIRDDGQVFLTPFARSSIIYNALPSKVRLPAYVNRAAVKWRFSYL